MPVRIGFIGVNGWNHSHCRILAKIPDASLVAFCDKDKKYAENAARRFEGEAFANPQTMLENAKLDAVYLDVPGVYKNAEILAAQAGCALFFAEPLNYSLKAAEKIGEAIEDAGVLSSIGLHYRYNKATSYLLKLLTAKNAPPISLVEGTEATFPTEIVDLARYLAGEIVQIFCMNTEGTSLLNAKFANGAIGQFSSFANSIDFPERLRIMASNQICELEPSFLASSDLTLYTSEETRVLRFPHDPVFDADKIFIEAVQTGKRAAILSPYSDAIKTLRVVLAAQKSAKTGKPVKL